jgi:hypothetical protein
MLANTFGTAEPDPNVLAHIDGFRTIDESNHGEPPFQRLHSSCLALYSLVTGCYYPGVYCTTERGLRNNATDTAHRDWSPASVQSQLPFSFSNRLRTPTHKWYSTASSAALFVQHSV